jgi:hypothetical protein
MPVHVMRFTGNGFRPVSNSGQVRLETEFKPDQIYSLVQAHDVTRRARGFYHHCLMEAWRNLPEIMRDELPSKDHLRKFCLIKAGHCTVRKDIYFNAAAAEIAAAHFKEEDSYCIVVVNGNIVTIYRAKSETTLKGRAWRELKERVLQEASVLIGVDVTSLVKSDPA